ncbi:MAG: penicillin acylase family protein, partial [Bacteroidetes bacterium]|nr:penicillin acylase family protein [Bacteroidota bacterium]
MRNSITLFISAALLAILLFFLATPIGTIPPIGKFFHPVQGFWANAETRPATGDILLDLQGVEEPVEIFFDERGVPHIFAENDHDLYFAQGYVTARDRLFQMELQARAAGGKLAEWLGERLIDYDRNQRRLGMMYGAEQAFSAIQQDEVMSGVISAYAEGVNAYIETLRYEDYPLEYKVLDVEPSEWSELNTALLLKYMTQTLAGRSEDIITSNTLSHFGEEFVNRYLSDRSQFMVSIIPDEKEWELDPQRRAAPDSLYDPTYNDEIQLWQPDPLNGSNNWVVDGSKTEGGYPMLSNDMHLNMTLPAIWYEVQLQTPDHNVYGVSLQGAPTVIVGFNEHMAWGSTNTGADLMDWYEITFRDSTKQEYLFDGEWLPVEERIEEIIVKGGETVRDTVLYTHHGPVYETDEERSLE